MRAFDSSLASPGVVLKDVDPSTLLSNRQELEKSRLDVQRQLIRAGTKRFSMIQVNRDGVIIQGNHGARAAAESGIPIEVEIVDLPHPHFGPILSIPVVKR